MSITGTTEPTKVGVAVADVVTGLYAAVGALAGLVARTPLQVEVGLLEAAVAMLVNQGGNALVGGVVPGPTGNAHPNIVPYGPLTCSDTALVLGAGNDAQFVALCAALGVPARSEWSTNAGRVAERISVVNALEDVLRTRTAREWATVLDHHGVPCAPVQDLGQLPSDPQLMATGLLQTVPHPKGDVTVVGSPYRLDGRRPRVHDAPPLLGQHTAEVLAALGLSAEQITEVIDADRG
jgi:crotonobetainyl-CoA:carnitine CoA-transferase CaiB-like acyl-CoA transferase